MEACPNNNSNMLIFLHIPKTAGSTLHYLFSKRYKRTYSLFAGSHSDEEVEKLRSISHQKRCEIDLLKGHMPFGLHEYLPRPARYFTMLRDPVKRVVSQYFYIKNNKENPLHDEVMSNNWTVGELIKSEISVGLNNGQTRWLTGDLKAVPFGEIGAQHLDQAIDNLNNHFISVGINEMFDQSILVLSGKLSWHKLPYYVRMNTNKNKSDVSEEDIEIIKHYNKYDIKLYQHGLQLLQNEIDSIPEFDRMFRKFQKRNNYYSILKRPFQHLGV